MGSSVRVFSDNATFSGTLRDEGRLFRRSCRGACRRVLKTPCEKQGAKSLAGARNRRFLRTLGECNENREEPAMPVRNTIEQAAKSMLGALKPGEGESDILDTL